MPPVPPNFNSAHMNSPPLSWISEVNRLMVPRDMLFNFHLVEFWFVAHMVKMPLGESKFILQLLKKIIFRFQFAWILIFWNCLWVLVRNCFFYRLKCFIRGFFVCFCFEWIMWNRPCLKLCMSDLKLFWASSLWNFYVLVDTDIVKPPLGVGNKWGDLWPRALMGDTTHNGQSPKICNFSKRILCLF